MRTGVTLIELIFSMVIIAIVFTVVPKIIFASNKSLQLGMKEDALYNALSLMYEITALPWDEATRISGGKIVNAGGLTCSAATGYRDGGFIGSRNCLGGAPTAIFGLEDADRNDIDDFDGYGTSTKGSRVLYALSSEVLQVGDRKNVRVLVETTDPRTGSNFQSSFFYDSANIGEIDIKRRYW